MKLYRLIAIGLLFAVPAAGQDEEVKFSEAELHQMLAPIALYPDALLSQILIAATYPLEIVEASRWSKAHAELTGEEAVEAAVEKPWDPSVQSMVAFPQILGRMYEDLTWTRRLGDAVLIQEEEVMDAVQQLRAQSYAAGELKSLDHLDVTREREVIVVQPVDPTIVYVPYGSPYVIYGGWRYPAYPPVYWGPSPGYYAQTRIVWVGGTRVSPGFFFSNYDWNRRTIVTVHHHHYHRSSGYSRSVNPVRPDVPVRWHHDPIHRRGVAYRGDHLNRELGRSTASGFRRENIVPPGVNQTRTDVWGQDRTFEAIRRDRERTLDAVNRDRERVAESLRRDRERMSDSLRGDRERVAESMRRERLSREARFGTRPGDFSGAAGRLIPGRDAYGRELSDSRGSANRSTDPRSGVSTEFRDRIHSSPNQQRDPGRLGAGRIENGTERSLGDSSSRSPDLSRGQTRGSESRTGIHRFTPGGGSNGGSVNARESGRGASLGLEVEEMRGSRIESSRGAGRR